MTALATLTLPKLGSKMLFQFFQYCTVFLDVLIHLIIIQHNDSFTHFGNMVQVLA